MKLLLFSILGLFLYAPIFAQEESDSVRTFIIVEDMPRFPGCEELDGTDQEKTTCSHNKLLEYIHSNVEYPRLPRLLGIEGIVAVNFIVRSDGSISNARIIRNPDPTGCLGKETLRLVRSMNDMEERWKPGKQDGIAAHVPFNLPINYSLTNSNIKPVKIEIPKVDWKAYYLYTFEPSKKIYKQDELDELPCLVGCKDLEGEKQQALCTYSTIYNYLLEKIDSKCQRKKNRSTTSFYFVIDKQGKMGNFHIENNGHYCLNELEVWLNLMKLDLEWEPALIDGKPVATHYKGSFEFKKVKWSKKYISK